MTESTQEAKKQKFVVLKALTCKEPNDTFGSDEISITIKGDLFNSKAYKCGIYNMDSGDVQQLNLVIPCEHKVSVTLNEKDIFVDDKVKFKLDCDTLGPRQKFVHLDGKNYDDAIDKVLSATKLLPYEEVQGAAALISKFYKPLVDLFGEKGEYYLSIRVAEFETSGGAINPLGKADGMCHEVMPEAAPGHTDL